MPERLITIATFNEVTEAHILKGRLESEGILCFLGDEHIVGAHPFYAVAVGGVKLKVTENDVEEAKAILKKIRQGNTLFDYDTIDLVSDTTEESTIEEPTKCPRCGSIDIGIKSSFLQALFGTKYKCNTCGNTWKL